MSILSWSQEVERKQVFCSNSISGLKSASFSVVLSMNWLSVLKMVSYSTLLPKSSIAVGFSFSFLMKREKQRK
jgi:hypothetical protein